VQEYKKIEEFIERSFGETLDLSAHAKTLIRPPEKPDQEGLKYIGEAFY